MIVTPFAREVKRLRADLGLTIRDLALALGKSVAYLGKIEAQGEIPGPAIVCEIAEVLKTNKEFLLNLAKESRIASVSRAISREYAVSAPTNIQQELVNGNPPKLENGGHKMAIVLSLINMKGGVGKTTLAMQLAHTADYLDVRTLVVDLDPQANLSQALMGAKRYVNHLHENKPTVVQIFDEYVPTNSGSGAPKLLDTKNVVIKKAGYYGDSTLDLIPSRLELARTLKNPHSKERRLAKALSQIQEDYDLIIIDCAPTESVLTDAAYFASRYVIVPIKPEFMATIGLPLLARSLEEFQLENEDHKIEIAGVVFNHSSSYTAGPEGQRSIREVAKISAENGWHICENQVKYSASYAKSAREARPLSRTSYARGDVIRGFRSFADEVFELTGIQPRADR